MGTHRAARPESPPRPGSVMPGILVGVCILAAAAVFIFLASHRSDNSDEDQPDPTKPKVTRGEWKPVSAEDRVCDTFKQLRARGDVSADALLGRVPSVPAQPFSSPEEVERMQCDFYLRDPNTKVLAISRAPAVDGHARYRFKTEGNISPPQLPIQRPTEVEHWGRTMYNLELIVEVKEGKLFGVSGKVDLSQ